jgi:hypothetical protein
VIGAVVRAAWSRLTRKQLLFLYPFTLGLLEALGFLAVYSAAGGGLGWSGFASANAAPWTWLQEHSGKVLGSPLPLAVALLVGLAVCVLAAAIRAPFFHAVTGTGYPLTPRSVRELARLSALYVILNAVVYVVPFSLAPTNPWFGPAWFATIVFGVLLVFSDYVVVFEGVNPLRAMRRSIQLVNRSWPLTLGLVWLSLLLSFSLATIYNRYFQDGNRIFVLLPVSEMLLGALLTTAFDVVFISLYAHLKRENQ